MKSHPIAYEQYITSGAWRARRLRYLKEHRVSGCRACREEGWVELHHVTYERLGREEDRDLVPLCQGCHAEVHRRHQLSAKFKSLEEITRGYIRQLEERRRAAANRKRERGPSLTRCACAREHVRYVPKDQAHRRHRRDCACHPQPLTRALLEAESPLGGKGNTSR